MSAFNLHGKRLRIKHRYNMMTKKHTTPNFKKTQFNQTPYALVDLRACIKWQSKFVVLDIFLNHIDFRVAYLIELIQNID